MGGLVFAASILTLAGTFQILAGLVALFNDEFYVVARNYTFDLDVSAWGWIHLHHRRRDGGAPAWACSAAGRGRE